MTPKEFLTQNGINMSVSDFKHWLMRKRYTIRGERKYKGLPVKASVNRGWFKDQNTLEITKKGAKHFNRYLVC